MNRTADSTPSARGRGSLPVVYFTVFLDLLGFGVLLPALPYWTRELGGGGLGLGLVLSSYSVAQFFGSPIFGSISDRIGRRPIFLLCLVGSCVSMTAVAFAPNLFLLCATRAIAGFFGGTIVTAQAYISDVTDRSERTRYLGLLGASIGLGFVLGPALGAGVVALGYGFRGAALSAAVLAVINLVWALFRLKETERVSHAFRHGRLEQLRMALSSPVLRRLMLANLLVTGTFVSLETSFAYFGADRFDLDAKGFGLVMFGIGLILVLVQGGLIGRLSDRFGDRPLALAGAVAMALGVLLIVPAASLTATVLPLAVLAVGRGLVSPTLSSMVSKLVAVEEQGTALGAFQAMAAAARAAVPLVAGVLYDRGPGLPFVLGSVFSVLAFLLLVTPSLRSALAGETTREEVVTS